MIKNKIILYLLSLTIIAIMGAISIDIANAVRIITSQTLILQRAMADLLLLCHHSAHRQSALSTWSNVVMIQKKLFLED